MTNGIPIKGNDAAEYITRTETGSDGRETQVVSNDSSWLLRMLTRVFGRFSFDGTSQLRVIPSTHAVTVSSGTVTTVTTVTTGNIGLGDMGKPATVQLISRQVYGQTVCANLSRS